MPDQKRKQISKMMQEARKSGDRSDLESLIRQRRNLDIAEDVTSLRPETLEAGMEFTKPGEKSIRIPGTREEIDTRGIQKTIGGSDFVDKIANKRAKKSALRLLKGGTKALPLVGGLASAIATQDASAAIPVLGDVEAVGPREGSIDADIESGERLTDKDRERQREIMRRALEQMRGE